MITKQRCEFEPLIAKSVRSGSWTDAARAHASDCAACRSFVAVDAFMQSIKEEPLGEPNLPSADFLWLKAQVLQQQKLAERAIEPMTFVQRIAYLVVAFCWALLITWKWPTIHLLTESFDASKLLALSFSGIAPGTLTFIVVLLGLTSVTAALTLHSVFAGE